jgi:hypothetical protein
MKEEQHGRVGKIGEKRNEKVNTIKIDSIVDLPLNWPWPFIFIGWGDLSPQGNPFIILIYQDSSIWLRIGGHRSDRLWAPVRRCTRRADLVEIVSPSSGLRFGRSTYES